MIRNVSRFTTLLMLASLVSPLFGQASVASAKQITDSSAYLVKFKDMEQGKKDLEKINKKVNKSYKHVKVVSASDLSPQDVNDLKANPNVEYIEKDAVVQSTADQVNSNLTQIQTQTAHENSVYGTGVKVALLDTGIDTESAELKIAGGVSFIPTETTYDDLNGHGTHVAGILAATKDDQGLVGVAPNVDLYAVKVLDSRGTGTYSQVIEGIEWAIDQKMDIVSMSLAGKEYSAALEEALQTAYDNGVLLFAATGNDGASTVSYPAKYSSVIGVGAVDSNNQHAAFSNTGAEVELVAPGVNIQGLSLGGAYVARSGTSMATPHAAGVAALIKEKNPTLNNKEIRQKLVESATSLNDEALYGKGLVNASAAVLASSPQPEAGKDKDKEPKAPKESKKYKAEPTTEQVLGSIDYYLSTGTDIGVETAKQHVLHKNKTVQSYAIDIMQAFGIHKDADALLKVMDSNSAPDIIQQAELAYHEVVLRDVPDQQKMLSLLEEQLEHPNAEVRNFAINKLNELATKSPTDGHILNLLVAHSNGTDNAAVSSYERTGDKKLVTTDTDVVVSLKKKSALSSVSISVTPAADPSKVLSNKTYTNVAADQPIDFKWNTGSVQPGMYKIRYSYDGQQETAKSQDMFTVFVKGNVNKVNADAAADETIASDVVVSAVDSYEPNDSNASATPVREGAQYNGYIYNSTSSDEDYYVLTASKTGNIPLELINPNGLNYHMEVRKADGTFVSSATATMTNPQQAVIDAQAGTTYYIKVFSGPYCEQATWGYNCWSGATFSSADEAYTLQVGTFEALDTNEPNNSTADATVVPYSGSTYTSYISSASDSDYYKFAANTAGMSEITLTVPAKKDYDVRVFNSSGQLVASNLKGVGTSENMTVSITSSPYETYYINVSGASGAFGADSYKLTIGPVEQDRYEPNDTLTQARTVSTSATYYATMKNGTDDYYKFTSTKNGAIEVKLSVSNTSYSLEAQDANGAVIKSISGGTAPKVAFNVTANTTYYIKVKGTMDGHVPYTLTLGSVIEDSYEPNSTIATAYPTDLSTSLVSAFLPNDQDYFKVTPPTGGSLQATLSLPDGTTGYLRAYDSAGALITTVPSKDSVVALSINITANTIYYLQVLVNGTTPTPYKLSSSLTLDTFEVNDSISAAYPVSLGAEYTSYIFNATDQDYYKFTVPTADQYQVDVAMANSNDYNLKLLDAAGNVLASSTSSQGLAEKINLNLNAGTYYVHVYGVNGSYGAAPYKLKVSRLILDPGEPNDTAVTAYAISANRLYSTHIGTSTDVDFYKFVPSKTITHHLSVKVPSTINYDVIVYDENMKEIASGKQVVDSREEVSFAGVAGKTYYIKVVGIDGAYSASDAYFFQLTEQLYSYSYDVANHLTQVSVQRGLTLYKLDFTYDSNGNLMKKMYSIIEAI